MVYNEPTDVRRALGLESQELTDTEISDFLQDANREMMARVGREQIDVYQGGQTNQIKLFFTPVLSVGRVYKNDKLLEEGTDYTVDLANGQINLTETTDDFDIVRTYYIPEIYKDLERAIACRLIIQRSVISSDGNVIQSKYQLWKDYEESLIKRLNEKLTMFKVTDSYQNIWVW